MDAQISSRKDDHIRLAQQFHQHNLEQYDAHAEVDGMQFIHQALPETGMKDVQLSTSFAGIELDRPYFINAMTGGTERANEINHRLARVAQATHSPMALGSMSIAVKNPETRQAYADLRQEFPDVRFIANLGAEHPLESAQLVTDLVGAQALQIHLNAAQEIVMPEGEKDFHGWKNNIALIVKKLDIPVIVKEVGFGMSYETVKTLIDLGVQNVDVAGRGGTNFVQIENARNAERNFDYLENWGITTIRSLMEALRARTDAQLSRANFRIIASGGVRNPLDIVKYMALGADAVGLSAAFLQQVTRVEDADEAVESTIALMREWDVHISGLMAVLGVTTMKQLRQNVWYTLPESLRSYMHQRFGQTVSGQ
ncbi:type 2 isopentenyl-diphosphate Delta-isomerase [Alloscardovia criceti]|uniref:type 2 isopentenyl-diphosphate Delta-isomerase n=1 Tax=Alloscardovia criceti TaxID=356828 RepID=UPI00035CBD1B|nr:type 2 isopentenyl-diphosphate Delta-isomerase [Alloscardovia criceti]